MSITGIISRYFNTEVTVTRRSLVADDIGGVTETWGTITVDLPAAIQDMSIKEMNDLSQGKEFFAKFKMYCPVTTVIRNGDRILDEETSIEYNVVGVETWKASRDDVATGHHYKIFLDIPTAVKT